MERKCAVCGGVVVIDKENTHKAIQYKKKFYHFDCFNDLCNQRIAHKSKAVSESWTKLKANINELVDTTTKEQQTLIDKDILNRWLMQQYGLSFMGNTIYTKLDSIYKGSYNGLAYAIGPLELHNEWMYYWDELCAIRQPKGIIGESAISYDLVIILSRNAEYRRIKEKEKVARELVKQKMAEEALVNINVIPQMKAKKQSKNKIADLYKEMNGGEDNE